MGDYDPTTFGPLTITELYEEEGVFRYLLHNAVGINAVQCRNKLVDDGYSSLRCSS